jgi:hypothetical protein
LEKVIFSGNKKATAGSSFDDLRKKTFSDKDTVDGEISS